MPLVSTPDLLAAARKGKYGVGYFEAWDLMSLEAVLEAAESENSPAMLGFGAMMVDGGWLDAGGVELLGAMTATVAKRANVPVSTIFNEAQTFSQAVRALEAGFQCVMLDSSAWEYDDAVNAVAALVREAHNRGASVEAELGRLPDAVDDGIDTSGSSLTDPDQAARFVDATGCDFLAVSVGNVHLLAGGQSPLDFERLETIGARTSAPLVLHGGTGIPADAVPRAVAAGVAKFNVGTILKKTVAKSIQATVATWDSSLDVHEALGSHKSGDFLTPASVALIDIVRERIRTYGSGGKA
ncbi:MAG: class II fructose-bisphosphate aldolase [Armatimonadaceae bacterium]